MKNLRLLTGLTYINNERLYHKQDLKVPGADFMLEHALIRVCLSGAREREGSMNDPYLRTTSTHRTLLLARARLLEAV